MLELILKDKFLDDWLLFIHQAKKSLRVKVKRNEMENEEKQWSRCQWTSAKEEKKIRPELEKEQKRKKKTKIIVNCRHIDSKSVGMFYNDEQEKIELMDAKFI